MLEENSIFRAVSEMERVFEDLLGTLTPPYDFECSRLGLKCLKALKAEIIELSWEFQQINN